MIAKQKVSGSVVVAALVFGLGACTHGSKPAAPSAEAPRLSPIEVAISSLDQGDEEGARRALRPLITREPGNPEAGVLIASIEQDPTSLLGPKSFPYVTAVGDTMIGLSEKFLGTRLKFYELARYNGVKVPNQLQPGTTLKIPGEAPKPSALKESPPQSRAAALRATRKAKPSIAASATPAAPRPSIADPAAAMRMRTAALAALNQGRADQAVTLLRRAASLAPGNVLIARDLARAQRISQTVHARR